MDSPWSQLYQHLLGITAIPLYGVSLHDRPRSFVAPQDSCVLHLFDPGPLKHQLLFDDSGDGGSAKDPRTPDPLRFMTGNA